MQLAKAAQPSDGFSRVAWIALAERPQAALLAGLAVGICCALWLYHPNQRAQRTASAERWERPDLRLTPGATVPVTAQDVCGTAAATTAPVVPVSLVQKVFQAYGVTPPRQPGAYEVDYLITPELGGSTDIRNLWPEPYRNTLWNARVKDQLEDRLHQMVCHGDLDLATAQHDISTDWIAAYRKYFHAETPVPEGSSRSFHGLEHSFSGVYFYKL
jgi:hypothetical protein